MGWASKTNGELLALASAEFDVFLTSDRNLSHQQNLSAFDIAVIVLVVASTASTICDRWSRGSSRLLLRSKRERLRPWARDSR
jgi:hypothetical protein